MPQPPVQPDRPSAHSRRDLDCTHPTVQVPYLVPVEVVVNRVAIGTGGVRRVVVIDEEARLDPSAGHRCHDCGTVLPTDSPAAVEARRIAEQDPGGQGWTSWDIGW